MNREQIVKLCPVFRGTENTEDTDLVSQLMEKGLSIEDAERIVTFLPIAFGRAVINKIGKVHYSDKYKIKESGKEFSLNDEPIYKLAECIAIESYEIGLIDKGVFLAIATRSHEVDAVNKALNAGEDINGAKFGITEIFGFETLGKRKELFSGNKGVNP